MANKWYTNQVLGSIESDIDAKLILATDVLEAEIKTRTPVDKGNLKGSFDRKKIGKHKIRFFNYAEYAASVEFGTVPHEIKAGNKKWIPIQIAVGSDIKTRKLLYRNKKTGKLQKSKSKNTVIFVKSVNHPGTKAQPYMRPGYRAAVPKMEKIMNQ